LQRRSEHTLDRAFPARIHLNAVSQRSDKMKVFTLVRRESFLNSQRVMRPPRIEFLETLKPVQGPGIVVTHACLFGIVV
jgi:hypothetical protein